MLLKIAKLNASTEKVKYQQHVTPAVNPRKIFAIEFIILTK
ncbi:MAG: hypothetical protein WA364_04380 [Candidatus Nitrosopolaris sp.]